MRAISVETCVCGPGSGAPIRFPASGEACVHAHVHVRGRGVGVGWVVRGFVGGWVRGLGETEEAGWRRFYGEGEEGHG